MKTITILIAASLTAIVSKTTTAASYETLGHQWFEKRAEGAEGLEAKAGPINKAISFLELAFEQSPTADNAVLLMRSYYFKGSFVRMSNEEQKMIFAKGKSLGEAAAKMFPASAPVKFWLAAMYGKWAKSSGVISAAKEGVADKIKKLSEEVIKIDANYNDAGGYEILGLVHLHSPNIPFVLTWPSSKTALENLQKAAQIAPTIANSFCYAQALEKAGKKELAIAHLKKLVQMQPRSEKLLEDRNGLHQAGELLKKLSA